MRALALLFRGKQPMFLAYLVEGVSDSFGKRRDGKMGVVEGANLDKPLACLPQPDLVLLSTAGKRWVVFCPHQQRIAVVFGH